MSLLRNFSPGGTDPDDDGEQPATAAEPDETAPPDLPQRSSTARYAYAAPTAGTADPVPGTVVESEVVPDPVAEPDRAEEPDHAEETRPAPVAETSAPATVPSPAGPPRPPERAPSPALGTPVPETKPAPVPSPTATGADEPAAAPASAPGPDPARPDFAAPLLGDTAELRARWQRVQGDFVDDPQEAVRDADALVGQTAEALMGALRQRQRQLRAAWERGASDGSPDRQLPAGMPAGAMASGVPDTEHLRLMMLRYRALFNQLCRP